jgi:hypothetical protein
MNHKTSQPKGDQRVDISKRKEITGQKPPPNLHAVMIMRPALAKCKKTDRKFDG